MRRRQPATIVEKHKASLEARWRPPVTNLGIIIASVKHLLSAFQRDQRGNIAILAAVMMPAIIGFGGFGTEVGLLYLKHQTLQSAADSSALSAAIANTNSSSELNLQADAVTATYGFVSKSGGTTVTVNKPPKSGTHAASANAVEVIITQPQARIFSAVWSSDPVSVAGRAVAFYTPGTACVLALNGSASGAITAQGNPSVNLNDCSISDNSSSSSALSAGGSASIAALSANVVGDVSGSNHITTTNGIKIGQSPTEDPYSSVNIPAYSGCNQSNFSAKTTITINAGVYCGGFSANANANVTFSPGVYVFDGGSFTVNGNAALSGTGVTLIFTSSSGNNWPTAAINGGASINLTAPATGATAGLVFFGDRNMPTGTPFKLNGGSSEALGGAVYLPKAALEIAGNSASSNGGCTQIIADTISFKGNSNFAINCTGFGTQTIGFTATLVE